MEAELFSARLKRKYRGLTEAHTKAKKASQPKHKLSNRKKPVKNMWCRRSFFNFYESGKRIFKKSLYSCCLMLPNNSLAIPWDIF